jgi:hypothetical protein
MQALCGKSHEILQHSTGKQNEHVNHDNTAINRQAMCNDVIAGLKLLGIYDMQPSYSMQCLSDTQETDFAIGIFGEQRRRKQICKIALALSLHSSAPSGEWFPDEFITLWHTQQGILANINRLKLASQVNEASTLRAGI